MIYSKFISLLKQTGLLRVFFKDDVRMDDGKVFVKSYTPRKQYLILGDEEAINELKEKENLPEVIHDYLI